MTEATQQHSAALAYAHEGIPIFPVHSCTNGRCSCGGRRGCSPGKHPRTDHGFKDASTDDLTIRRWWAKWPNANIGMPTGRASGRVVLDIDPRNGGDVSLEGLLAEHGPLPETIQAVSGGGGTHYHWAYPGQDCESRRDLLPGIDFKAEGGYVLLPPSAHASGRHYEWELSHLPGDVPLAAIPAWLLNLAQQIPATRSGDRETERTEITEPCCAPNGSISQSSYVISVISVLSVISVSADVAERIAREAEETVPRARGQRNDAVFQFARGLKAIPAVAGADASFFRPLIKLWHRRAYPNIGTKPFEDTWADFLHAWPRVIFAKGEEPMALIVRAADATEVPSCCADYEAAETIRLVKLCRQLQRVAGDKPFFISCRIAGELLGIDHNTAWKRLTALLDDGIIRIEGKPTKKLATRYRYIAPD